MRLQFGLRTFLFTMILATSCLYAGWLTRARLRLPVAVSPTDRRPSSHDPAGMGLVKIDVDPRGCTPGDRITLFYIDNETSVETHWTNLQVWSVDAASVFVLAAPDIREQLNEGREAGGQWRIVVVDDT